MNKVLHAVISMVGPLYRPLLSKDNGDGTSTLYVATNPAAAGAATSTAAPNVTPTTGATVLAANTARKGGLIQNLGTSTLYVFKGASATTSKFTVALPGGSANDDGFGGSFDLGNYTGAVSVAGTTPRCAASEDA